MATTQTLLRFTDGERKRLSRQHSLILDALRMGPKTNVELSRIGMRFGGRLKELRDAGYEFTKRHIEGGVFEYTLIHEPFG
jgi:hypothetical protein